MARRSLPEPMRWSIAPGRSTAAALLGLVLVVGCASPPVTDDVVEATELPLKLIEPVGTLAGTVVGDGLATRLRVVASLEAVGELPLTAVTQRGPGEAGDDALLDFTLRWKDFSGRGPVSSGRTVHELVPFGPGGVALPGAPLQRAFEMSLTPPQDVLARRVEVSGRLYVLDLSDGEGRTGGALVPFSATVVESYARPASRPLSELLVEGEPEELFLAAVSADAGEREGVIGQLIGGLGGLRGPAREAAFGALLYLTGETHGRSEYRWMTWWRARQADRQASG